MQYPQKAAEKNEAFWFARYKIHSASEPEEII